MFPKVFSASFILLGHFVLLYKKEVQSKIGYSYVPI